MSEIGHNNMTLTTVEQETAWEYLEAYLRYSNFASISFKLPILSTLRNFHILKLSQNNFLFQTTVKMCETSHNNMAFTTVEQKIAWDCLEAYLKHGNFA